MGKPICEIFEASLSSLAHLNANATGREMLHEGCSEYVPARLGMECSVKSCDMGAEQPYSLGRLTLQTNATKVRGLPFLL